MNPSMSSSVLAGAALMAMCLLLSAPVARCGDFEGADEWSGGFEADDGGHGDFEVSHAKVAKVSYVKTPIVSTHFEKKPVISYVSKPVKSIKFVSKPIVSLHSVPVITKSEGWKEDAGWKGW